MNILRFIVAVFMIIITPISNFTDSKKEIEPEEYIQYESAEKKARQYEEFMMGENDVILNGSGLEEAINEAIKKGTNATIWLHKGEYKIANTISLKNCSDLSIKAYPGEKVTITSGYTIDNFTEETVNGTKAFVANIDKGILFNTVYKNDTKLTPSRYPESGYLTVKSEDRENSLFTDETSPWEGYGYGDLSFFYDKDFELKNIHNPQDVQIKIMHYWVCENTNISKIDSERIWLKRPCSMRIDKGNRYYLENVFETLNAPNEYYIDRENSKLYYIPEKGATVNNTILFIPSLVNVFDIENCNNISISGIEIKNTDWEFPTADKSLGFLANYDIINPQGHIENIGVIDVRSSQNISITNCDFKNIGNTGIRFYEEVKNSEVISCSFLEIGSNVIVIHGKNTKNVNEQTSNITVKDNLIKGYGRNFPASISILLTFAKNCELAHNEIADGYYTAISVGWIWGYDESLTDNIKICDNLIYKIGQGWLSDMGGIYTLGTQPNTVISGNVIHDVAADKGEGGYGGWGIYLDEGSSQMTVENNLVYKCGSQSFHQHYGKGNIIRNNIFALSDEGQVRISRHEEHIDCHFESNIFLSNDGPIYVDVDYDRSKEYPKFTDNNNLYYDLKNGTNVYSINSNTDDIFSRIYKPLAKAHFIFNNGQFANPLFKDAENFDFALATNSPAFGLINFVPWNYANAGTLSKF